MLSERAVLASDGTRIAVQRVLPEEEGRLSGSPPLVLLHGLTATRRYVLMGSRLLERAGCEVISYDARGHGESARAAGDGELDDAYGYARLADDLRDVLDELGVERAALAGASMGAHSIARFALENPERVAAVALVTPAFDGDALGGEEAEAMARWDALAHGLRARGIEGFLAAYDFDAVPEAWRGTVQTVVRQRLAAHRDLEGVADALEAVPRSRPFEAMGELSRLDLSALVVGSRDEADPGHPLAVAQRWAAAIPGARLLVEDAGSSPIAWQGGQLSRAIAKLLEGAWV